MSGFSIFVKLRLVKKRKEGHLELSGGGLPLGGISWTGGLQEKHKHSIYSLGKRT